MVHPYQLKLLTPQPGGIGQEPASRYGPAQGSDFQDKLEHRGGKGA